MKSLCERARRWTILSLDGELRDEERSALDAHLRVCESCRSDLESYRAFRNLWTSVPSLPSLPLDRERIRRRAAAGSDLLQAGLHWADLVTITAAAACLVLAGVWVRDLRGGERRGPASFEVLTSAEWSSRLRGVSLPVEGRSIESMSETRGDPSGRRES